MPNRRNLTTRSDPHSELSEGALKLELDCRLWLPFRHSVVTFSRPQRSVPCGSRQRHKPLIHFPQAQMTAYRRSSTGIVARLVWLKHHGLCELFKPKEAKCPFTVFVENAKIIRSMRKILHDKLEMPAISLLRHREG